MALSLSAIANGPRVQVSGQMGEAAWTFDPWAIDAAARELGVRGTVRICMARYERGRYAGMYSHAGGAHSIRVAYWLGPERASEVLWHELTHAAQHDRGDRAGGTRRLARTDHEAYLAHPREVEARANEARAADAPLVRVKDR